jgi:hypothetical protein
MPPRPGATLPSPRAHRLARARRRRAWRLGVARERKRRLGVTGKKEEKKEKKKGNRNNELSNFYIDYILSNIKNKR